MPAWLVEALQEDVLPNKFEKLKQRCFESFRKISIQRLSKSWFEGIRKTLAREEVGSLNGVCGLMANHV